MSSRVALWRIFHHIRTSIALLVSPGLTFRCACASVFLDVFQVTRCTASLRDAGPFRCQRAGKTSQRRVLISRLVCGGTARGERKTRSKPLRQTRRGRGRLIQLLPRVNNPPPPNASPSPFGSARERGPPISASLSDRKGGGGLRFAHMCSPIRGFFCEHREESSVSVRPRPSVRLSWRRVIEWWRTGLNAAGSWVELLRDEQSASGSWQRSLFPLTNKAGEAGGVQRVGNIGMDGERERDEQQTTEGAVSTALAQSGRGEKCTWKDEGW